MVCQRLSYTWFSICKIYVIGPIFFILDVTVAALRHTWASGLHRGQTLITSLQARCVQSCYSASGLIWKEPGYKRGIILDSTVGHQHRPRSILAQPWATSVYCDYLPVGQWCTSQLTSWTTEWTIVHAEYCPKEWTFLNTRNWNSNTRKTLDSE